MKREFWEEAEPTKNTHPRRRVPPNKHAEPADNPEDAWYSLLPDEAGENGEAKSSPLLDEAYEALSRLYNKSHRRGKTPKAHRKEESWR
ncbi:MAG: hypothetical protein SFZ03_06805 [Candidatus Melainabacteria bacterium]|nr:hypothetical protein [Candidatus Melainabacteria bacterium]